MCRRQRRSRLPPFCGGNSSSTRSENMSITALRHPARGRPAVRGLGWSPAPPRGRRHVLAGGAPDHRAQARLHAQAGRGPRRRSRVPASPATSLEKVTLRGGRSARDGRAGGAGCARYGALEQRPSRRPRGRSSLRVATVAGGTGPPPTRPAEPARPPVEQLVGEADAELRVRATLLGHGTDLAEGAAGLVAGHRVLDAIVDLGEERRGRRRGPTPAARSRPDDLLVGPKQGLGGAGEARPGSDRSRRGRLDRAPAGVPRPHQRGCGRGWGRP